LEQSAADSSPSAQFSKQFRESLNIVLDSLSEKAGTILVHPQSDLGVHQIMVDAPWACMARILGKKYGNYSLYEMSKYETGSKDEMMRWMATCSDDQLLDSIGCFLECLHSHMKTNIVHFGLNIVPIMEEASAEVNDLFRSYNLGFEVFDGNVRKVDAKFLHSSVVKEAVRLLRHPSFEGPVDEYQRAIDAYTKGNFKETVRESSNAFESTLKALLTSCSIAFKPSDTASRLIKKLIEGNLLPSGLENFSNGLSQIMSSGLPTIANPVRHGQGSQVSNIDEDYASFALHLSGSYIVFLIRLYDKRNK
jgi:hypothetical protein